MRLGDGACDSTALALASSRLRRSFSGTVARNTGCGAPIASIEAPAALMPPAGHDTLNDEGAGLEYAIRMLGVRHIVVCAHSKCGAMNALAELRAPVDAFFEKVTVNAPEPKLRENHLRLLSEIREATLGVVTDTQDAEGETLETNPVPEISEAQVRVAAREQALAQVEADEACRAGDENAHRGKSNGAGCRSFAVDSLSLLR